MIRTKRIYDPPAPGDGRRYLVDRLWPRGLTRDAAALDGWLKDLAPSDELRRWSHHDPARWEEFRQRYWAELEANRAAWTALLAQVAEAEAQPVTLLYAARDTEQNNAVALQQFLEQKIRSHH